MAAANIHVGFSKATSLCLFLALALHVVIAMAFVTDLAPDPLVDPKDMESWRLCRVWLDDDCVKKIEEELDGKKPLLSSKCCCLAMLKSGKICHNLLVERHSKKISLDVIYSWPKPKPSEQWDQCFSMVKEAVDHSR